VTVGAGVVDRALRKRRRRFTADDRPTRLGTAAVPSLTGIGAGGPPFWPRSAGKMDA
jgi:hypothetical protein